jgi:ABC-type Fe3+ transport system substrate-binding protein
MLKKSVWRMGLAAALLLPMLTNQVAAASPEWIELVKSAQKEGKVEVILGGQMPRLLRKIMPEFTKKYGIKVNFQTGSSRKHAARIRAERKSGVFSADVWIGGTGTALSILLPNKMLTPLKPLLIDPDVTDPKRWYKGRHYFTDPVGSYILTWGASPGYIFAINTNLVKPEEIKSYWDIFNPKWKGKIVARSPASRGASSLSVPMLINPKVGRKWFERWASEMDVTIIRDSRQAVEWLATGRFAIAMFGLGTPAQQIAKEGFPVLPYLPHVMKEGETLANFAANIMAMERPANPNAQKLFINWALSKEGQSLFVKTGKTTDSLRVDVPRSLVAPQYQIKPDRDYYISFADPKFINEQRKHLKTLGKIMKKARKKKK